MSTQQAEQIARLGLALQLRDAQIAPVLAVASAAPIRQFLVGASVYSSRLELVLPFHPAAFAAAAPGKPAPANASQLRLRVDRDAVGVATSSSDPIAPRAAVADIAFGNEAAWLDLVEQFTSVADARIVGRTRYVTESRAQLDIGYPQRDRQADQVLMIALDQLGGNVGVTAAQRKLWQRIHPELGRGRELTVATSYTTAGVSQHLGVTYPVTDWQTAVRLASGLALDDGGVKDAGRTLGQLAGAIGTDRLDAIQLVLGPHEPPEVVVWARVAGGA